jgi:hypothetical protein
VPAAEFEAQFEAAVSQPVSAEIRKGRDIHSTR